jgi:hypothetical protein
VRRSERGEQARAYVNRRLVVDDVADVFERVADAVERGAVDVLEDHHELSIEREEIVEAYDAVVVEARVDARFLREALLDALVGAGGEQAPEHDVALKPQRAVGSCEQKVAHLRRRELSDDAIPAQALARGGLRHPTIMTNLMPISCWSIDRPARHPPTSQRDDVVLALALTVKLAKVTTYPD